MEPSNTEFMGAPCGKHGPYTFYKAFKYSSEKKCKILCLGQFFYVRILRDAPVCIGELQLLWEDRNHEGVQLSSVRLYFLPEHTPDGRLPRQGEDEVLAESEKVVLKVEDLISWIVSEPVSWPIGHLAIKAAPEPQENGKTDDLLKVFAANNSGLNFKDVLREQQNLKEEIENEKGTEVVILSYPSYCRYRAILLRLENVEDKWMKNAIVNAIGGFTVKTESARVMFCRNTFEHPDLEEHEFRSDWLAPNLKGRPRKKKPVKMRDDSDYCNSEESENSMDKDIKGESYSSSSSRDSSKPVPTSLASYKREYKREVSKPVVLLKPNNKEKFEPDEERFLHQLYSYMRDRGTPIERIPTLGFREVDLFEFYSYGRKLGGYEDITQKRLWKHIYDKLGGHPANTSAATCTRRHYEKLLLPYERYERGQEHKPLPTPYQKPKRTSESSGDDSYPRPPDGLRVPKPSSQVPLSQHNWKTDQRFLEKERKWEEMRRMKNLNRDRGAMVRRTVKDQLLYRQQVKAEQHASTSQHFTEEDVVVPKQEPTKENHRHAEGRTEAGHPRNGAVLGAHGRHPGHRGHVHPGEVKQEPGARPSVIQQTPKSGRPMLNPAPAPRSHLHQPTVYGPPNLLGPHTPPASSSKRPYPFTEHKPASSASSSSSSTGASPSISIKDLDPYFNGIKRPLLDGSEPDKNHFTAKIKNYAKSTSPIVIEDNDADQPLDFSMKTLRRKETEVKQQTTTNHRVPATAASRRVDDAPMNLTMRSREPERSSSGGSGSSSSTQQQRYSPYNNSRTHAMPESHNSATARPPSHNKRSEGHPHKEASDKASPQQSQRAPPPPLPLPLPINIPTSAMAAIVHPAFPQLSGSSNMLPPGVMSPQYAQPFLYQAPLSGLPSVPVSQAPKLPTSQPLGMPGMPGMPGVPGQALFLPTAPFVIPAAHLYPQLYGQAPPVQITQKTEK